MLRYVLATFAVSSAILVAVACGTDNGSVFPGSNGDSGSDGNPSSSGCFGVCTGDQDVLIPDFDGGAYDPGPQITLKAIIRDFRQFNGKRNETNPDFEIGHKFDTVAGNDTGLSEATGSWLPYTKVANGAAITAARFPLDIVQPTLGDDGVPVYTTTPYDGGVFTFTTNGRPFFDQWYRDVDASTTGSGNIHIELPIVLDRSAAGVYVYDSAVTGVPIGDAGDPDNPTPPDHKEFFPIDDAGFGKEGAAHNYSFTVELRTEFQFKGNETFTFSGDDDVFVFINKKLAMNIGGIHEAFLKKIDLAQLKDQLGLKVGEVYSLDFFQAERHATESNLRIETTLGLAPPGHIIK